MPTRPDPRVLVVAEELDQTADLVVEELHHRGVPLMRFDLADFPQRLRVVADHNESWRGVIDDGRRVARLERVGRCTDSVPAFQSSPIVCQHRTTTGPASKPSADCWASCTHFQRCG
ncbi:MAG: hypothetical protein GEU96_06595 [Propionibacteriales bacterium]|nr:hypothetical protein [Propionibacteriales bacterium]